MTVLGLIRSLVPLVVYAACKTSLPCNCPWDVRMIAGEIDFL